MQVYSAHQLAEVQERVLQTQEWLRHEESTICWPSSPSSPSCFAIKRATRREQNSLQTHYNLSRTRCAASGCMAAKPDTAKLPDILSELEDYLPTVGCLSWLEAWEYRSCSVRDCAVLAIEGNWLLLYRCQTR